MLRTMLSAMFLSFFGHTVQASGFLSQLQIDLAVQSSSQCRESSEVFFGRHTTSPVIGMPHDQGTSSHWQLACRRKISQQYQLQSGVSGTAATWWQLKDSSNNKQFIGVGLRFRTEQGVTDLRLRGRSLSFMYRTTF